MTDTATYPSHTLNTNQFDASLQAVLITLNKTEWLAPLTRIARNFDGVPPLGDIPIDIEMISMLWSLVESYKTDPDLPHETLAAIRFCKLLNFTVRASHPIPGGHSFWNPLEQSFASFKTPVTRLSQSGDAYPPEDIIKRWARDNLL